MISLDPPSAAILAAIQRRTGRSAPAILRLLARQAAVLPNTRLEPDGAPSAHLLQLRPDVDAARLRALARQAGCRASRLARQLLAQARIPDGPDIALPPVLSVVRPWRHRRRAWKPGSYDRHAGDVRAMLALLRAPEQHDARHRLRQLAAATGRSQAETLRLLILSAHVAGDPDVILQDGPVVVRLRSDPRTT